MGQVWVYRFWTFWAPSSQNHWQCFNLWLWNVLMLKAWGSSCELFAAMNTQIEVSNSPPYHWCCLSNIFVGPPYIILGSGVGPRWAVTSNKWLGQSFLAKYLTRASIFLSLSICISWTSNRWNAENGEMQVFLLRFPTREGLIIFREYEAFFPIAFLSASYLLYNSCLQFYSDWLCFMIKSWVEGGAVGIALDFHCTKLFYH